MSITVYWASCDTKWMLAKEPDSVSSLVHNGRFFNKSFEENKKLYGGLKFCPAFNKNLNNVFALRSLYDYEFQIKNGSVFSSYYDQQFFNNYVKIRSIENKCFSFPANKYIFFTEEPSLNVSFYEFPVFEDNNITKRCVIIPGQFDIGRWFRNSEFAFFLRDGYDSFKIERDEIYSYIRFHTDKKINFKQFVYSQELDKFVQDAFNLSINGGLSTLEKYYKTFKTKKLILKKIKSNLCD